MNPIAYCMNVHRGDDLPSVLKALETITLPVGEAMGNGTSIPVGFRFGAELAALLRTPERLRKLASYMRQHHLSAIGINGFPYGSFHGEIVKTAVYEPDWTDARRIMYTRNLFYALTQLPAMRTPEDHPVSVTTVPLAYDRGQGISDEFLVHLCDMTLFLRKLEGFTGQRMCLALEPEPDCLLETTTQIVDFFERLWLHPNWNPAYRDYIGICFDTCHFALGYEEPLYALRSLVSAKVPVARIQVSAALEFTPYTTIEDLQPFLDTTYLHQTRRRENDASITYFPDLTVDVLREIIGRRGRIHYHLPLAWSGNERLGTTRNTLTPAFWRYVRAGGWPVEAESYAYFVLPDYLRKRTLSESILEDLTWIRMQLRNA